MLCAVLKKHWVRYDVLATEADERLDLLRGSPTLWLNDKNELIAFLFRDISAEKMHEIFDEVANNHLEDDQFFPHLKQLGFYHCNLETLPDSIQKFTNLRYLSLDNNSFTSLPNWLQKLEHLEELSVCRCKLRTLPEWLQKLTSLKTLYLGNNNLQNLPDFLQYLTNLEVLGIWNNSLQNLPDWLQCLTNLNFLNIRSNKFKTLPDWLPKLTKLNNLQIQNNPLKTIPSSLLDFLQKINASGRFIKEVTIADVPDDITKQGWEAIRQYYLEKEAEDDDTPFTATELKVMIVGAGSAGKSSISKAMAGEAHNPNEESTVGIALKNIRFQLQDEDWTLRVWDFGGQEAYAATQTLFMTNNTLYLVVADGRTENRPDPYLHYIKTFAPESPVILLINKVDENERADLNRQVYLEEHKNLHPEMVRFSCVDSYKDKCVEDLREKIETVLFESDYGKPLRMQWKKRWRVIRKDLLELLEQKKTHIDAQDYYDICKNRRLPEAVWPIIRNLCNDSGIIFSYTNEDADIDLILHPGWVTQGVNTLCTLPEGGFYSRRQINEHMSGCGYDITATNAILQILKTAELAYELPGKGARYFFPALLPGEEPDTFPQNLEHWALDDEGNSDSCEMRFRYPFLHPVVKQIFMVRMCANGMNLQAFRYGACWHHRGVRIVMMEKTDDIAFYLYSGSSAALIDEQKFLQGMMEDIHKTKGINGTLYHVFRTADGGFAEYSNADLWTLKDEMGVDELPLPGIRMKLSVAKILAGFHKTKSERRTGEVNIHIGHTAGGDIKNSPINVNVDPTPEQTLFAQEATQAIGIINGLDDLNQEQKNALIELMKDANAATQENDEDKKKSCREKFKTFALFAGNVAEKVLQALSDVATITSFFAPKL